MSMRAIIPRVFKNLGKFPSIQIPFLAVFINSIAKSSKGKRKIRTSSLFWGKKKRRENNVESNLTSIEKMPKMLYGSCIIPSRFDETKARDANVISSRTNGYGLPTILFRPSFPNFRVYVSLCDDFQSSHVPRWRGNGVARKCDEIEPRITFLLFSFWILETRRW